MKKIFILLSLFILFAFPGNGFAHALTGELMQTNGAITVQFLYSSGDAGRYIKAEVFAPDDSSIEHQSGRTDKNGRFSFFPDVPGEWKVIATDNQGHRAETFVQLSEVGIVKEFAGSTGAGPSLGFKVALGLSLILNLSLVAFMFSRRKSSK